MIEYLFIFILSVIFSIVWEWTHEKYKRAWYLYVGTLMVITIAVISSVIFNPQSPEREVISSWKEIPLVVSSWIGWIIGKKIYHFKS